MANNSLIVDERQRDLGNFLVGRLLPVRQKRQVGPFTFIDHMGPSQIRHGSYMDVNQHPHIGLSTLTYLFEGAIEHRDSIGSIQVVNAGDVGFMTAGKGVTHTERTPAAMRDGNTFDVHGYQIWVALPKEKEEMDPQFEYYPKNSLPEWSENGLKIRLVAGEAFGRTSPLQGFSRLYMIDMLAETDTSINLTNVVEGEIAFVIVKGHVEAEGEKVDAGQMMISKTKEVCQLNLNAGTHLLVFGGEPLPEERYLSWNFVSSSKERLKQARADWARKAFPKVPGDHTYIPFPIIPK